MSRAKIYMLPHDDLLEIMVTTNPDRTHANTLYPAIARQLDGKHLTAESVATNFILATTAAGYNKEDYGELLKEILMAIVPDDYRDIVLDFWRNPTA